jgi:hypothetical protein
MGVAGVYTPKDYKITSIMADVVKLVAEATSGAKSDTLQP